MSVDTIEGAPAIPGLVLRHFRGESDFPGIVDVYNRANKADNIDRVTSIESTAATYANLKNSDPYKDMLIAEVNSQMVGYSRVVWWKELNGPYLYGHFGFIVPEWRGKGIGTTMLHHNEARSREIAAGHQHAQAPMFDTFASNTQPVLAEMLESEGYKPVRYGIDMVKPDLDNIPELPLPEGIETRPVKPEHLRAIWKAEVEAFKDHWGADETEESDFERWKNAYPETFKPELWQIAWDGDRVAGIIRNFIDYRQNEQFKRKRGYTEDISVGREWRRRGLARALLARSFQTLKEQGMTEAALSVDTENPNGALQLYQSMGFEEVRRQVVYRKPLS